jgi:hypothetical protein
LAGWKNYTPIVTNSRSLIGWAELCVILVNVSGGIGLLIFQYVHEGPGAIGMTISNDGVVLTYSPTRSIRIDWKDPDLEFDLVDCTGTDLSVTRTPAFPYSVVVKGRTTVLTAQAHDLLSKALSDRGLHVEAIRRTWFGLEQKVPIIRRIRASDSRTPVAIPVGYDYTKGKS